MSALLKGVISEPVTLQLAFYAPFIEVQQSSPYLDWRAPQKEGQGRVQTVPQAFQKQY